MGTVWVDTTQVGTFTPDEEGTTGDVYCDSTAPFTTDVGDFTLAATGYVYLGTTIVGVYTATTGPIPPPPPPPPPEEVFVYDPRERTKLFLDTYLEPDEILKVNGVPAVWAVLWAVPDYPLSREFRAATDAVDLLFVISKPDSKALLDSDQTPYGYDEEVTIETYCIDKTDVVGTKLKWQAEKQLRKALQDHPFGSHRSLSRSENNDQWIGGVYVYGDRFVLSYMRGLS